MPNILCQSLVTDRSKFLIEDFLWSIPWRYILMRITWCIASKRNLLVRVVNCQLDAHWANTLLEAMAGPWLWSTFPWSSGFQKSLSSIIISKPFSPWSLRLCLNSWVCCQATSPCPLLNSASNVTSVAPEKSL